MSKKQNYLNKINQPKKIVLFFIIFLVAFYLSLSLYYKAFAVTTKEEIKTQIDENKQKIDILEVEIKTFNSKISNTKEEAATLKEAIQNLEFKKSTLTKEIDLASTKIENTQYSISNTETKILKTGTKIDNLAAGISDLLRNMHYINSYNNDLSLYVGSLNFSDFYNKLNENTKFRDSVKNSSDILKTNKKILEDNKKEFETDYKILNELQDNLEDKKFSVEQNKKESDDLLTKTKKKESEYKKQLDNKKKVKKALQAELLDFESKLKAIVDVTKLPKQGNGILAYPVKNITVTQYFGNTAFSTKNPQVYNGSGHNGIDFAVSVGTALYSAADGVVLGTGNTDESCGGASYGKWVLIKHNNGLTTLYAHMSSFSVSGGQSVTLGQKIGLSGNTGYSTGPHLHFTVYASDAVHISGPTEYKSKSCGTYMRMPLAPRNAYLNPLSYL
jgi:murein DD-endopeptidase MepM/ murein hydrolase activator NlpD